MLVCFPPPPLVQSPHPCFCSAGMKLYAAGLNAWNQLAFHHGPGDEEPEDVARFRCILENRLIESPYASLSCTVGTTDSRGRNRPGGAKRTRVAKTASGLVMAGSPEAWLQKPSLRDRLLSSTAAVAGNATIAGTCVPGAAPCLAVPASQRS